MLTINLHHFPLREGDRILDLGCGEGRHAIHIYLQANVTAVGIDMSMPDLKIATDRSGPFVQKDNPNKFFYLQQADAAQLPYADNTFDKVICSEVLEHLLNYHDVLDEIRRVLKPDGLLAISVPRAWPEKLCWKLSTEYHQVEGGHVRIFNADDLRGEIEQRQFKFVKQHFAHALHSPYWWLKCLWWKSQERSRLIKLYHRLLVWDLMRHPWLTRTLEKLLNPLLGKSVVMYFRLRP